MTKQQQITLTQVRCKISEARRRALTCMEKAMESNNEEEFDKFCFLSAKAAKDMETWQIVLRSLNAL